MADNQQVANGFRAVTTDHDDLVTLQAIACESFAATFGPYTPDEDIQHFNQTYYSNILFLVSIIISIIKGLTRSLQQNLLLHD